MSDDSKRGLSQPNQRRLKEQRIHRVAQLLLRQYEPYEIWEALAKEQFKNPETGKPFDITSIYADIRNLEKRWQKESVEAIDKLKARNIQENREARRLDWQRNNTKGVYQGLAQEAKVLGLDAPTKIAETNAAGDDKETTNRDRARAVLELLSAFGAGAVGPDTPTEDAGLEPSE